VNDLLNKRNNPATVCRWLALNQLPLAGTQSTAAGRHSIDYH
jgi:hypothetical protein